MNSPKASSSSSFSSTSSPSSVQMDSSSSSGGRSSETSTSVNISPSTLYSILPVFWSSDIPSFRGGELILAQNELKNTVETCAKDGAGGAESVKLFRDSSVGESFECSAIAGSSHCSREMEWVAQSTKHKQSRKQREGSNLKSGSGSGFGSQIWDPGTFPKKRTGWSTDVF